jgi:hypothetical protein
MDKTNIRKTGCQIVTTSAIHHHIVTVVLKELGLSNEKEEDFIYYPVIWVEPAISRHFSRCASKCSLPQVTLEEFLCQWLAGETVEVVLNSAHTAKVTATEITVGCQTFPIEVLDKLVAARDSFKS